MIEKFFIPSRTGEGNEGATHHRNEHYEFPIAAPSDCHTRSGFKQHFATLKFYRHLM